MIDIMVKSVRCSPTSPGICFTLKFKYFFDETKEDYEIQFDDGDVLKQRGKFCRVTADWCNDGDTYEKFGAYFVSEFKEEFFTPYQLVDLVSSGKAVVPGLRCEEIS